MGDGVPTGVVAFLFTDVEGSTRLWEADSVGMGASLAEHDRILRDAIAGHGGHVFSTAGDAFAAAFHSVVDALGAATSAQLELAAATWPGPRLAVRMGIHVGTAQERDGDYFGPVLNRAARIMSAGNGGQVLVSSRAVDAVNSWRAEAATLNDLGTHHLKDLDAPERLFELRHPGLAVITTPVRTVEMRRHNLPAPLTTFVGRDGELARFATSTADHRLTVLTGTGGTGKTRLAIEGARSAAEEFTDGAWLVELAPITNPAFVMTAIGDTWGLRPGEGADIEDVVIRYLWGKEALLVIDNCEHLLDASAAAIRMILDGCPSVRVVATSRESLGIPGEAIVRVPSLALPDDDHDLRDADAVRLFLDRAAAAKPGYEVADADLEHVRRIVTRIDGIPLGLELAAARLRSLSLAELADHLDRSFRILSGSEKATLPRQRTLEATIEWSHELLKPTEAALFRRLSVFSGGFDLAAAEAVCGGDPVERWAILDHVDSLVDKSLVVPLPAEDGSTRFRMLEPIRQFAEGRLADAEEAQVSASRHAEYFAGFVSESSPHTRGPDQMAWERRLDRDYDNIRTAFGTLLASGEFDAYLDMAFNLFLYWMHLGMHLEGIETTLAALDRAPVTTDPARLVKAWFMTAGLGAEITRPEAIDHARAGLAVAEATDDLNLIGRAQLQLGAAIRHSTTDPAYLDHLTEGRRLLEANPEPYWWEPDWDRALLHLICSAYFPAEDERSLEHVETALQLFEETGDQALLAATLSDSAGLLGRADEAWIMGNLYRSIEILGDMQVPYWYGHALQTLGIVLVIRGEEADAQPILARAAGLLEEVGDVSCWASSSRYAALCETSLGDADTARRRMGAVLDALPILPMQEIAIPRTLDTTADVLAAAGRSERSAIVLGGALTLETPPSVLAPREVLHERIRDRLDGALTKDDFERLVAEGGAMDLDTLVASARTWLAD